MSPDVVPATALSRKDYVTPTRQRGRPQLHANATMRQRAKRARDTRLAQLAAEVLFPYWGGKGPLAPVIWQRLGAVTQYIEPFCGSAAVFLQAPWRVRLALLNDTDGHITNTLRSLKYAPKDVAGWADWPANELDLDARSVRLQATLPTLVAQLRADDRFYDVELAGLWVWRMSSRMQSRLGRGRDHLQVSTTGHGIHAGTKRARLPQLCQVIGARLSQARILCRDWRDVVTEPILTSAGTPVGIFFDPPYTRQLRDARLYADDGDMAAAVAQWAIAHGGDARLRIALCGLQDEHAMPAGWTAHHWQTRGGMANTKTHGRGRGATRQETVWFSPHCLPPAQLDLLQGESNGTSTEDRDDRAR